MTGDFAREIAIALALCPMMTVATAAWAMRGTVQ